MRSPGRVDVSREAWFSAAKESGDFVLGDLRTDPLSGELALVAARPIPGASGSVLFAAIDALRSNMLQGVALPHLAVPLATLLAWLIVPFVVAMKIFRWR